MALYLGGCHGRGRGRCGCGLYAETRDKRSVPCQRSEKKGQRQKVDFFMKCER